MPSRRVMSCSVIFLPCRFMVSSLQGGGNGVGVEAAIKHLLGKEFGGAGTGSGHDVQVAGVLGQEVAQAFDLHEYRDAVAVEHRAVDQLVAGYVLLHLGDHAVDRIGDARLVRRVGGQAVDGVAHDQRRLGRVDDDDRLALLRATHLLDGTGGGAGELVDVLARARTDRAGGHGGDDLAVLHRLHAGHCGDHGDGGLAAAGDHVDVENRLVCMLLQVDRRHDIRTDGGRCEVNHQYAQLVELAAVLGMHIGRGGIEGDADVVLAHVGQQAVDTFAGGLQTHFLGALEAFGGGVDADHPYGFQYFAALQLVQQVGADIAWPDQGTADLLAHGVSPASVSEAQAGVTQSADVHFDMVPGSDWHQ